MAECRAVTRPCAIVFDWDNTLVDTWEVIGEALNRTLTRYGLDRWSVAEVRERVRRSMRESFPVLFGAAWKEAGDHFLNAYAELHLARLRPLPGAEDLLRDMKAAGIPCVVVSNKTGPFLREEVEHLRWENLIVKAIGAGDAALDKPAADPVRLALMPCCVDPGPHVWLVGDTDVDLECAAHAGCTGVLLRPDPPRDGEFVTCPPTLYVSDCVALSKQVRKL